ncbi:glycosyltransferase family 4 protein [Geofilum rubicundum]|nr:glycosyltransferase family 4 protein [Geofilum rubicundum]
MNIVLITQYYRPEMGAPQSRLFEMLRGLKLLGAEVSVVTAMPNYPEGRIFEPYRGRFVRREERDGLDLIRYWLYASNSKRTFPRILSMLSFSFTVLFSWRFCAKKKPDFIIVESPPLTLALSAWILARLTGSQLITNVSDLWPLSALELGVISRGRLYGLLERLERFIYKRSDGILGQSQEIVDYIRERGFENTYLFRNGVDFERFREIPSRGEQNDRRKIVYAGLLGFAQGILNICRSIDFGSMGLEFHIYGAGTEKEQILKFIKENPGRGIVYNGVVSREDIPAMLKQHDGALIPLTKMIYGAVPSKIYEAMAAELPVLFSGEGEGARIIAEHQLGWVNHPGDIPQLRRNLEAFAKADLATIRATGRRLAETTFNRPNQVKNLYDYLEAIDKKP